jgi:hypothetical protein
MWYFSFCSIQSFVQHAIDDDLVEDCPRIYDLIGEMFGDMLLHQRKGVPTLQDFIPSIKLEQPEKILKSALRTIVCLLRNFNLSLLL